MYKGRAGVLLYFLHCVTRLHAWHYDLSTHIKKIIKKKKWFEHNREQRGKVGKAILTCFLLSACLYSVYACVHHWIFVCIYGQPHIKCFVSHHSTDVFQKKEIIKKEKEKNCLISYLWCFVFPLHGGFCSRHAREIGEIGHIQRKTSHSILR